MSIVKKALFLASASVLFLTSCRNSANLNDSITAIPKDAASVTAINLPSILQKADFESVKNMEFYKSMISESEKENPALSEIVKDPKKSGIDLTKNLYLVSDYDLGNENGAVDKSAVLMSIADVKAFEAMLQNAKMGEVQSKEGIKFISMKKEHEMTDEQGFKVNYDTDGVVAWNDKIAVITKSTEGGDFVKYFKTKSEESIAQNEHIKTLMSKSHDMYSYFSFDKYADNIQAKAAAGAMNIDPKALKGNYFTGYSDFEKGQIVSKSDFKINKDITKEWGLMFKDNVKTDFSKYLNGQNLGFALTLGLDMKGLKEIINANSQFRMATKMTEGAYNFSIDDLCKALDGDVVIAGSPVDAEKWTGMMGFRVSDKPSVQKLLDILVKENIIVKDNETSYHFAEMTESLSSSYLTQGKVQFVDDVLFVGDAATVNTLNGKGSVNGDVKDVLNKNIFGLYANTNKILSQSEEWKDPEITDIKLMIKAKEGESVFKMKDTNENSLKSLIKMIDRIYIKSQNQRKEDEKVSKEI